MRGTNTTTIVPSHDHWYGVVQHYCSLLSLTCFVGFIKVIYVCNYAGANSVDPTLSEKWGKSIKLMVLRTYTCNSYEWLQNEIL